MDTEWNGSAMTAGSLLQDGCVSLTPAVRKRGRALIGCALFKVKDNSEKNVRNQYRSFYVGGPYKETQ